MNGAPMFDEDSRSLTGPAVRSALETGNIAPLRYDMSWGRHSGQDIDAALDERGRTLLMESAQAGRAGFVRALIDHGAHVEQRDVSGYTALLLARDYETAKVLIEAGSAVNAAAHNGVTALSIAAQRGELPLVRLLLTAGADIEAATRHGSTPIMRAAENGHLEVVDVLLDAGADPFRRNRWDRAAADFLPELGRQAA